MLFGVKASSNLFTHLFINVKLGVAGIVEYGTFERVYFSADEHLLLLVFILEARKYYCFFVYKLGPKTIFNSSKLKFHTLDTQKVK